MVPAATSALQHLLSAAEYANLPDLGLPTASKYSPALAIIRDQRSGTSDTGSPHLFPRPGSSSTIW